ncbi:unnamed protein product [Candidula unifasciata]|uniref:Uncharacterized protein n=1 Tax=Candidula unifasciata TaxID=100452 RepID=A0A8S3Z571_9EUPU|nr:unnamed protein product [Candidula unifasciata]
MNSQLLLAICTLCFAGCHGFFGSSSSRHSQASRLLQVTIRHLNGTLDEEMSTYTCSCAYPHTCSSDWTRSGHVISRNLLSTTHNITMNMMFCQAVQPQRECTYGEQALVVSGSLTIPYDVVSINCRCRDSTPLLLKERSIGPDYLYYHYYVCDSHMMTCQRSQSNCATLTSESTTYNCKCPNNRHCRITDPFTHGRCM